MLDSGAYFMACTPQASPSLLPACFRGGVFRPLSGQGQGQGYGCRVDERRALCVQHLERGIAHYYTDQKLFDSAGGAAALMRKYGVARRVVSTAELLKIEPAFSAFAHRIVGGTYTASDESGDARVFTQSLARRCAERFLYGHDIVRLEKTGNAINSVAVRTHGDCAAGLNDAESKPLTQLKADAVVAACGSFTAPLLRTVGVDLPIYPGKGYSATFRLLRPERAPFVSTIDDEVKCAISRLGNAGHGTLGWTHGAGSGKAMAALISGEVPDMDFDFYGFERSSQQAKLSLA